LQNPGAQKTALHSRHCRNAAGEKIGTAEKPRNSRRQAGGGGELQAGRHPTAAAALSVQNARRESNGTCAGTDPVQENPGSSR